MNVPDEVASLLEKIRHYADEAVLNGHGTGKGAGSGVAGEHWPPIPAGDMPAPPPVPAVEAFPPADPVPLAEAATLVPRAAQKMAVHPAIPGFLRPMFRNQGGFNGILLQTCGRLVEVSEHLQQENAYLRARLDAMADHLREQNAWLASLAQANTEGRQWQRAAQGRIARVEQRLEQRFEEYDGRCNRAEIRLDRAEGLLDGVRAAANEHGGALARLETQVDQQQVWTQELQALADRQTAALAQQPTPETTHSEVSRVPAWERLERHNEQIRELFVRCDEHAAHLQSADARLDQMEGHVNYLQGESDEQHRYIQTVHGHLDRLGEHLGRVEEGAIPSEQIDGIAAHTDRLGVHLRNLQADSDQQDERLEALQRRIDETADQCARARQELEKALAQPGLVAAGAGASENGTDRAPASEVLPGRDVPASGGQVAAAPEI
jgi:chromosome segregation ATPase